jgi:hypothetical protein
MSAHPLGKPTLITAASLALLVWACDGSSVVSPRDPDPTPAAPTPTQMSAFVCQASPNALTMRCSSAPDPLSSGLSYTLGIDWSSSAPSEEIIFGGQHINVDVISSNITNDSILNRFAFDIQLKNLRPQPIGTTNGVTTDSSLSIFFHSGPTTTGGIGTVTVFNPTGFGSFTGGGQPYFNYPEILIQNATSANKNWILQYDEGVASFAFILFISANVKYPFGYIDVYPATSGTVVAGSTLQMTDSVRDALGVATADQSETWSLSDSSKASIDANGLLTGVSTGTVVVTATQGLKTGSASVLVTGSAPSAVADSSASISAPGVAYHTALNTAYNPGAPGLLSNDNLGSPAALITSFGGGSLGGPVTANLAGSTVGLGGGGSLTVNADGSISFTPSNNSTGYLTFNYRLANTLGSSEALVKIAVGARPSAADTLYSAHLLGNVGINTSVSTNTKVNATGDNLVFNVISTSNGTAAVHADGTYEFRPNVGFTGAASFTYTASNGFPGVDTATVGLTVDAPRIWFVDSTAEFGGDGRYGTPMVCFVGPTSCLSGVATANGDIIHIKPGTYSNTASFAMLANQRIIGQGAAGPFSASLNANVTWPADAGPEPATGGSRPRINSAGANVFSLATGNAIRGIISGTSAGGASITGSAVGTFAMSEAAIINPGGGAFHITASGEVVLIVDSLVVQGGTQGVYLNGTTGSFTSLVTKINSPLQGVLFSGTAANASFGSGFIQSGTDAVSASGGSSGTLTFAGSISNSSRPVLLANASPGPCPTATFSGPILGVVNGIFIQNCTSGTITFSNGSKVLKTGANKGVQLANNTGATIQFTNGGLIDSTTTGAAFEATGGGTVIVTGAGNILRSTTGVALNVANTTIGTGGLVFQSISADGAPNGIVLNTTGSTAGLSVTGNGGACTIATPTCTGGVIANTTGADDSGVTPAGTAIVLNSTTAPSFVRMWIHDNTNYGVRGTGVVGFLMDTSVVDGVNGGNVSSPFDESSMRFDNLTGSASLKATAIYGGARDNLRVANTAGSLDRLTVANSAIGLSGLTGFDGVFLFSSSAAGAFKATIQNTTFAGARDDMLEFQHNGTGAGDLVLSGNTFHNTHTSISFGNGGVIAVSSGTAGTTTMSVTNNSFRGAHGSAFLVEKTAGVSTQTGTFSNNTIGAGGFGNSGSVNGSGLSIQTLGQGTVTWGVTNNAIRGYNESGIELVAGGPNAASGNINATITGNTIAEPGNAALAITFPKHGVLLDIGLTGGDTYSACAVISGNSLSTSGADGNPPFFGTEYDIRLRQRQSTTIRLPGYGSTTTNTGAVQTFVAGNNSGASVLAGHNSPPGGGFTGSGSTCP